MHARLSARAKDRGEVFQDVLTPYGIEPFLYRLSCTPARDTLWQERAPCEVPLSQALKRRELESTAFAESMVDEAALA